MATTITGLSTELTADEVDPANDWMEIEDVSAGESKKVHPASLTRTALFEWNRQDLTQFDTGNPIHCEDSLGNESGSAAATVVTNEYAQTVLRITTTSLAGCWFLPILESELVLSGFPKAFRIEVAISAISSTSLFPLFGCISDDAGSAAEAVLFELSKGSAVGVRLMSIMADRQDSGVGSLGTDTGGVIDDDALRGVVHLTLDLYVTDAPDDALTVEVRAYRAQSEMRAQDGVQQGTGATGTSASYLDLSATAGEPIDKVALGLYTGVATSGTIDILDFKVFPHPTQG